MSIKETAHKTIQKFKSLLNENKIASSQIFEKDYNYEFTAKPNNVIIKIQVYFGKKGVKTVLQGDSASKEYKLVHSLISDQSAFDFTQIGLNEPNEYIGSDECGKGDFFGPLVIGAVYVDSKTIPKLAGIGVRDSKELGETQIHRLASEIKKITDNKFQIISISPKKYNELYGSFNNLNKFLNWAHSKAIENLIDNTKCKYVITDKFSKSDLNISSSFKYPDVEFIQLPKAEKYIGVAAASIIARDNFNHWFLEQMKKGTALPKGSSNNIEATAAKLLAERGEEKFSELAKLHFKTFKKVKGNL